MAQALAPSSLSLDELIALNDEIQALVRAGLPLEQGLVALGHDLPGALGRAAGELGRRSGQGASLDEAIGGLTTRLPPVYRAVVRAGARAGRLPEALECLAVASRQLADTRRSVAWALAYPLLVVLLAWMLFLFFVVRIAPGVLQNMTQFGVPGAAGLRSAIDWGPWGIAVALTLPLLLVLLAGLWWWQTERALLVQPRAAGWLLGRLPWVRRLLDTAHRATFAEILALLIEHGVPLHEALPLAAEAGGNPRLIRAAETLAEQFRQGQTPQLQTAPRAMPPLLLWLLLGSHRLPLPVALRQAAGTYHERARRQAERIRLWLPVILTVSIGGTATLVYALTLLTPWIALLRKLSQAE